LRTQLTLVEEAEAKGKFGLLSIDLWLEIFKLLDFKQFLSLLRLSKQWYNLICKNDYIWRNQIENHYPTFRPEPGNSWRISFMKEQKKKIVD